MRLLPALIAFAFAVSAGCKTTEIKDDSTPSAEPTGPSTPSRQPDKVFAIWQTHIKEEVGDRKLMNDCAPRHFPAKGDSQGVVVYFHGFTACPQQFYALGEALAGRGYDVFVPLLPGQGREPLDGPAGKKDNLADLPVDSALTRDVSLESKNPYQILVNRMNELADAARGAKIVIGLSGGGALATGAAVFGDSVWDRGLIFAPFYKIPGAQAALSATIDFFYPKFKTGWGGDCKIQRTRENGRAGICDFQVQHARGMLNYGIAVSQMTAQIDLPIQFVGAEGDTAADNGKLFEAYKATPYAELCFYRNVPHAMVAANESGKDPFWVPSLERDTIAFVEDGTWFPTAEERSSEYDQPLCVIERSE